MNAGVVEAEESRSKELEDQFEELALPYLDQIYGAALGLTRNPADAEDLTQEVYLRAFDRFATFEQGTNIRAWLYRLLTTVFVSEYRKKRRDLHFVGEPLPADWQLGVRDATGIADVALSSPLSPSAESEAMSSLKRSGLLSHLQRLPDAQRRAVYLSDVAGFSYSEVAAILDVPLGTVNSRISRGREALRKSLLAEGGFNDGQ